VQTPRSFLLPALCLLLLAGCGSSSLGTSRGSNVGAGDGTAGGGTSGTGGGNPPGNPIGGTPGPTGSNDLVVATPSVAGPMSVMVGSTRTLSIAFNSSDGRAISGFGVTGSAALPAGWSGPGNFACASVSAGSGCVLNLDFAPAAAGSGTFTLEYVYVDNSTMPNTGGSVTIAYTATANNNVVAAASPVGEINAAVGGGGQPVSVNFTTDDGYAATGLVLTTDLSALPAGWSSAASSLSCAIVSTGSGCQLSLTYTPLAASRGTLTLNYSFVDDSGTARTGSVNIPYSAAGQGRVTAAASPAGQINAIEKTGGQAVAVTFTTDDGTSAADFYLTTDLAALPAGWSSGSKSFSCSSVATGNGCQLHLTYAPTALGSGTLVLNYGYGANGANTGSFNLAYAATTDDNVVGTPSPTGQINAVVGAAAQPVAVTFTTDDGRPATALQLTSSLTALPAGWSSPDTTFACSGLSSGNGCQLLLTYAPGAAGSGMLALSYSYDNDAGKTKTGSLNIAYRATTNDSVIGTPNPNPAAVVTGSTTPVTVTFTTNDGNPAANLLVTSDLGALPTGWSSASGSFNCAAVSTGTACQLSLIYAPAAADSGTLSLSYSYDDNSGTPKLGTVSLPYSAAP
jgi:hypothetical protein